MSSRVELPTSSPAQPEKRGLQSPFLDYIGRPDIKEKLSAKKPWVYFSAEVYDPERYGLVGGGGLGILAGDINRQAKELHIPFVVVTTFFPKSWRQEMKDRCQQEIYENHRPEGYGFVDSGLKVGIKANGESCDLNVYRKDSLVVLTEPGLGCLYASSPNQDHRLFQEMVLGWGGAKALIALGIDPAVVQLNESASVFAALARVDELCQNGFSFAVALKKVRGQTVFTNHSLVPAVTSFFTRRQYEQYVFGNIQTAELKEWLEEMIEKRRGQLDLGSLSLEFAGKCNGVSRLHANIASGSFRNLSGELVKHEPITNGISLERWTLPDLLRLYQERGLLDQFGLPYADYLMAIDGLGVEELRQARVPGRKDLRQYLLSRVDQDGQPVSLPADAFYLVWAKRFSGYKRPKMIFEDQGMLSQIFAEENFHLIMAGKVHPDDWRMKAELSRILDVIGANPELRERVHYIQDYDDELALHLASGADGWLNTPEVGKEACGTSWMKALVNLSLLQSTWDGGVADSQHCSVVKISGRNYAEEVQSLYAGLRQVGQILRDEQRWRNHVCGQLKEYLPTVSGARMVKDYLDFIFPREESPLSD